MEMDLFNSPRNLNEGALRIKKANEEMAALPEPKEDKVSYKSLKISPRQLKIEQKILDDYDKDSIPEILIEHAPMATPTLNMRKSISQVIGNAEE